MLIPVSRLSVTPKQHMYITVPPKKQTVALYQQQVSQTFVKQSVWLGVGKKTIWFSFGTNYCLA